MSIDVYLRDLLPCCRRLTEAALEVRLQDSEFKLVVLKAYALKHNLHNGATMRLGGYTYRNKNLFFWDAQNMEIIEPFTEIDYYGSVPPRFVVGDGYFNPYDWINEVDHNTYVFPARPLINEMKEFAQSHPKEKRMIVEINGSEHLVSYSPSDMKGKWDSCVIDAWGDNQFTVFPGLSSWRETIIDEKS